MKAGIKDHRLPYTEEYLSRNLKCSDTEAEDFLLAQSANTAKKCRLFRTPRIQELGPA
jgi:hypothetical protein